jgi:hypothetical protein
MKTYDAELLGPDVSPDHPGYPCVCGRQAVPVLVDCRVVGQHHHIRSHLTGSRVHEIRERWQQGVIHSTCDLCFERARHARSDIRYLLSLLSISPETDYSGLGAAGKRGGISRTNPFAHRIEVISETPDSTDMDR